MFEKCWCIYKGKVWLENFRFTEDLLETGRITGKFRRKIRAWGCGHFSVWKSI